MNFVIALSVVTLSGFIALSYEILWFRAYSFVSGNPPAIFGLILGFYLLGLGVGAYSSRAFCKDRTPVGHYGPLRALAVFMFAANCFGFLVLPVLAFISRFTAWWITLPMVSISAGMLGATLPLVSHYGIAPDQFAGLRLSYLYLGNILGSASGSLLTGFVLMDIWSIQTIALFLALIGLALVTGLLFASHSPKQLLMPSVLTICGGAILLVFLTPLLFNLFYERLQFKKDFTKYPQFADVIENRSGVITVTHSGIVYGGGVYDGKVSTSLVNDIHYIIRAYGIAAIHPNPRRILMIGIGSGSWAQVISNMPGLEKLTIIEINPGYLKMISKQPEVSSLLSNPKVEVVIDDGRRWLANNPNYKFDVIVSNTTFHWRAHSTNLLSYEFLELIRQHLLPGGIYHFNTTGSEDAMKTAFAVFNHGFRFVNFMTVSEAPIHFDKKRWEEILSHYQIDRKKVFDLAKEDERRRFEEVVAFADTINKKPESYGLENKDSVLAGLGNAQVITDDNMLSEWRKIILTP